MFRKTWLLNFLFSAAYLTTYGQFVTECPKNIGFEDGTFSNWQCYAGDISQTSNNQNNQNPTPDPNIVRPAFVTVMPTGPAYNRHSIIKSSTATDHYGKFPLSAPNGSEYFVQLGNNANGRSAERISYTVSVPTGVKEYSIIFSYAVVFENPFMHDEDEQPKFEARVYDVTTNRVTSCGSFDFVAPGGRDGALPGFAESEVSGGNNSNVLYKPWSSVLVNLNDYIGRNIRLEFTVNDCSRGGHFGYAYIDFNENCSIPITGNVTCPGVNGITLKALPGFQQYTWYNMATGEVIGTKDSVVISPAPPVGTEIGVELMPYSGLGCTQLLSTVITGMAMTIKDPPPKCITEGVDLTDISLKVGNSSDLTYTYWRDSAATLRVSDPKHVRVNGRYYVKGTSSSGCFLVQGVTVICTEVSSIIVTDPEPVVYPNTVDITKAFVREPGLTYSYWNDAKTTVPVKNPRAIRFNGTFYIKGTDVDGCSTIASVKTEVIINDIIIPNTFTPNGDGVNDVFTILVNSKINIRSLKIMNRWGETVFLTSDITNFWTGFKEDKRMPEGVYYWVLEGDDNAQKRFMRSGYVTIVR